MSEWHNCYVCDEDCTCGAHFQSDCAGCGACNDSFGYDDYDDDDYDDYDERW
jgi:hypothetical protein